MHICILCVSGAGFLHAVHAVPILRDGAWPLVSLVSLRSVMTQMTQWWPFFFFRYVATTSHSQLKPSRRVWCVAIGYHVCNVPWHLTVDVFRSLGAALAAFPLFQLGTTWCDTLETFGSMALRQQQFVREVSAQIGPDSTGWSGCCELCAGQWISRGGWELLPGCKNSGCE